MLAYSTATAIIALVVRNERRTRIRVITKCCHFASMPQLLNAKTEHRVEAKHPLQRTETSLRLTYTVLYAYSMSFVSPVVYDNSLNSLEDNDNPIQHHSHSSHQHQHQHQAHRRGRRRKEDKKQQLDESLKEKVNAALRIHKLKTTQELAQQFNIELQSHSSAINDTSQTLTVERIASSLSSKSHSHYAKNAVSNCDADDETKTSKSELMHRFLSSTSANDDSIDIGIDDELADHSQHNHEHYSNYYRNDGLCSHQSTAKTKSIDSVGDEIRDILSQLPPLNLSEIAWSDSDFNETNNDDINNENNNCVVDDDQQTNRCRAREVSESHVAKLNGDYKWEYVNGTYDSETDWKEWHQMSSAVSYNGELLHILPYVNIKD